MSDTSKISAIASRSHHDSLLECLVILSGLYLRPATVSALKVGLPLQDGKFTPELFTRAANRIDIDSELVSKDFKSISTDILPCVLLLHGQDACILKDLTKTHAQVMTPSRCEGLDGREQPSGLPGLSLP